MFSEVTGDEMVGLWSQEEKAMGCVITGGRKVVLQVHRKNIWSIFHRGKISLSIGSQQEEGLVSIRGRLKTGLYGNKTRMAVYGISKEISAFLQYHR